MVFNNALYYPTIDIKNEQWIRSALLLWDSIETIVPEGMDVPYQWNSTRILHEAGFIKHHIVNPWNYNVTQIGDKLTEFLSTKEGKWCFINPKYRTSKAGRLQGLDDDPTERRIREQYGEFYIHASKLPYVISEEVRRYADDRGFIRTTSAFLSFYMTLLTNNICRNEGLALVTDKANYHDMSGEWLKDIASNNPQANRAYADSVLYKYVIEGLNIDRNTPIDKLLKFKEDYHDELSLFKAELESLTSFNMEGLPAYAIEQQVKSQYNNRVVPSMNQLKRALDGSYIKWLTGPYAQIVITGIAAASTAAITHEPLLVTLAGTTATALFSVFTNELEREDMLTQSPYSYLLRANTTFSSCKHTSNQQ